MSELDSIRLERDELRRVNQQLRDAVTIARESRDTAEQRAKESVQAEMAELRAELTASRATVKRLNRRAQDAEHAVADAMRCTKKLADGSAWCGGSLGRALLAHHNSQLRALIVKLIEGVDVAWESGDGAAVVAEARGVVSTWADIDSDRSPVG